MQVKSYLLEDIKSIKGKYWSYKIKEKDVASYLQPSFRKNLPDPNILRNMDKTIDIIIDSISKKKRLGC